MRSGHQYVYSLYLRGFQTTGKLPTEEPSSRWAEGGAGGKYKELTDVETRLASALERTAPLIALGRPGEQLGAGRVATTDEDWQNDFRLLASGATALLLLPSDTASTLLEIGQIMKQQLLDKTLFFMPTYDGKGKNNRGWAEHWESVRVKARELGLILPEYRLCGMVFKLDQQGLLELFQTLGRLKEAKTVLDEMMQGIGMRPDDDLMECPKCGFMAKVGGGWLARWQGKAAWKSTCNNCFASWVARPGQRRGPRDLRPSITPT